MLINTAPITVEGGAVGSVVVTMQNLRPLEEQERQRAEFVGMVSHDVPARVHAAAAAFSWSIFGPRQPGRPLPTSCSTPRRTTPLRWRGSRASRMMRGGPRYRRIERFVEVGGDGRQAAQQLRRGGLLTKVLRRHQGDHTRDAEHQAAACIYFAASACQRDVGVVGEHQSSVHA